MKSKAETEAEVALAIFNIANKAGTGVGPSFSRTWNTATEATRIACAAVARWHLREIAKLATPNNPLSM